MKKSIFGLAAMAVAVSMASCSLDEVMEQPAEQAIGFSSFVGKPTKSLTELIKPDVTPDAGQAALTDFWVFGNYGTKDGGTYDNVVFTNEKVTVSSSSFTNVGPATAANNKYWVADKDYMFAAYSNGNTQLTTTSAVSFGTDGHITITDYVAGDNDLILATPAKVSTDATIASQPSAVPLTFSHLLSQVAFEFKNGFTNGYKVKITGLKFSVNNKATYSYKTNAYLWTLASPASNADKSYTVNSGNAFAKTDGDKTSEYNFIIPQSNKYIKASFTVEVSDDKGTVVATKEYKEATAVPLATGTSTTPSGAAENTWVSGYKYKYTATIDANVLGDVMFPIQFTVTKVDDWSTASSDTGLDLDGNSN